MMARTLVAASAVAVGVLVAAVASLREQLAALPTAMYYTVLTSVVLVLALGVAEVVEGLLGRSRAPTTTETTAVGTTLELGEVPATGFDGAWGLQAPPSVATGPGRRLEDVLSSLVLTAVSRLDAEAEVTLESGEQEFEVLGRRWRGTVKVTLRPRTTAPTAEGREPVL